MSGAGAPTSRTNRPAIAERRRIGTRVLTPAAVHRAGRTLLGIAPDELATAVRAVLRPVGPERRRQLFLHSATPQRRSLECDLDEERTTGAPSEISAWIEGRAAALANPGDAVVARPGTTGGRPHPAIERLDVPDLEHYYLSHALLALAVRTGGSHPVLAAIARRIRAGDAVRVYCLDVETQLVVLFLAGLAGVRSVRCDGNVLPEIWTSKSVLHPAVHEAAGLEVRCRDGAGDAESAAAPLGRMVGAPCPVVPGYTLPRTGDRVSAHASLALAARLLRDRHGVRTGCLKFAAGGAGMRIRTELALDEPRALSALAADHLVQQEDVVLEAHVDHVARRVADDLVATAPSVHIRARELSDGATLQLMAGRAWRGNVTIDAASAASLGLAPDIVITIRGIAESVRAGLARAGCEIQTGGFDFAVGRLRDTGRPVVAIADPNLLSTGAELLHAFAGRSACRRAAATLTVTPTHDGTAAAVDAAAGSAEALYALPGRWAMLAAVADRPAGAVAELVRARGRLAAAGLVNGPQ